MTFPSLMFAILIALLCGALFHVIRDGGGWRLLYYFGLSLAGFAAGEWVHAWRGWDLFMFGALDLGMGILGSVAFLLLGEWLSRIEVKKETGV
ncbi:MAG: hypothetical protein K8S20_04560 [Chloroflexi bacterium]|jgi:hypothetical protein|nr:hypothetical protein [Chloroflexota bacterium]